MELILSRKTYTFGSNDFLGMNPIESDNSKEITTFVIGSKYTVNLSAPGSGKITYVVCRIDQKGLWGRKIADTSGIMSREDLR